MKMLFTFLGLSLLLCPRLPLFVHSVRPRLIISWGHTKRPALHLDSDASAEGGEEGELRGTEEIWVRLVAIMIV